LTQVLSRPSDQAAQKAQEWAQAYRNYAMTAMAGLLLPILTGMEPVLFSGGVLAGAAALFPGKEPLVAMLTSIMSRPQDRYEGVAQQIATALDTATRTVVVNFAPPPGSTVTLT
jgi:hypothetical protein